MVYRSAFDGYKGLTDQPVQSWRESNDTVGRIGGWQSYAREGQGGPVAGSAGSAPPMAPAASPPGPAKAPATLPPSRAKAPAGSASAAMPADHSGHTKP